MADSRGLLKGVRATLSCPCGYVRFLRKRGGKKSYAASKLDGIRRKEARFHEMSGDGGWGLEMVEMCLGYVMI